MIVIKTKRFVDAVIEAPPSKSYTQRALIVASLARGKSVIRNPLFSDDTDYMVAALQQFGVKIEKKGNNIIVYGTNGRLKSPDSKIFVGNAGTAMRFLTTLASIADGNSIITGDRRMRQRPVRDLLAALRQLGVRSESDKGFPPVKVYGGSFNGGNARLNGSTSSQYLSSILMCAPYAKSDVTIGITGDLASKPYIDITTDVMENFGVGVKNMDCRRFMVRNNKKYKARYYTIEGDASNASYFFAAAAATRGRVMVKNINPFSKQGDIKFLGVLEKMGCEVRVGKDFAEVKGNFLKDMDVDMNGMPDIVPTLAVLGLFADSITIRNVPNLRMKETDRLRALALELRKIGADVDELRDGLKIKRRRLKKAVIDTYNDHRMAMGFAIAGLVINGVRIKNPSCVRKSFPDFWKKFRELYKK